MSDAERLARVGRALIKDGVWNDALGKLSRHEATQFNALRKTLILLEEMSDKRAIKPVTIKTLASRPHAGAIASCHGRFPPKMTMSGALPTWWRIPEAFQQLLAKPLVDLNLVFEGWDEEAAEVRARICVGAKRLGRSAGAFDIMIAAHAEAL